MDLRVDTGKLHDVLTKYELPTTFEVYQGTHTSAVAVRFQNYVLPFFSKNLCFSNTTASMISFCGCFPDLISQRSSTVPAARLRIVSNSTSPMKK